MSTTTLTTRVALLAKFFSFIFLMTSCAKMNRTGSTSTNNRRYSYLWKVGPRDKGASYKAHVPRMRKMWMKRMELLHAFVPTRRAEQKIAFHPPEPPKFAGRDVNVRMDTFFLDNREFTISVWDGRKVDGDIISLYVGGDTIIKEEKLTEEEVSVLVKIPHENVESLILFAHNLGEVGENTASVRIDDGENRHLLELNSNLNACEGVTLVIRE